MLVPNFLVNNDILLKGDKVKIEIMWNLLNNDIKSPEKRSIYVCKKKGMKITFTVTVKDSGSGIDIEYLSELSTKFVT